jgi:RNA polymerase sigma-70 factor (ECF subfamily)
MSTGVLDPDASLVARVQGGDREAFAGLVDRHQQRLYRTLMGVTGNAEDAEDSVQSAFVKAYQHLGSFQGAARFSTWLTRIAINEGLERLRKRKDHESLDDPGGDGEEFRPRQIRAWEDDPERRFAKEELRALVEREVLNLPAKYRIVVMMRDIEEMSTEETAEALGLSIPAVKTRLMRARLMLREALAPAFQRRPGAPQEAARV